MIDQASIKNILIRGTNWIGDAVMTTPSISAIGRHFSGAEVTLLALPQVCELLLGHPAIDHYLIYEDFGKHRGVLGKGRLIQEIRSKNFDLMFLLQNAFESALIGFLSGIPMRYGYRRDGRSVFLTHGIPTPKDLNKRHQVFYYQELLKPLSIHDMEPTLVLRTSVDEDACAMQRLSSLGIHQGDLLIGFNPGATYGSAKRWAGERFADLGERLVKNYQAKILLFGNKNEESIGIEISKRIGVNAISLSGKTTLRELMSLLKCCQLLVTNDSGPMHIAAALEVPVVAIFGPTNPITTSPFNENTHVIRREVECSPCDLRECPIDHRCMDWITVGEVFSVVIQKIETGGLLKRNDTSSIVQKKRYVNLTHLKVGVFLDRDGTLNKDVGYVDRKERMAFYPRSIAAIKMLNRQGIRVFLVTNQAGIARGIMSEATVQDLHQNLENILSQKGAYLDGIYYCPHHPEGGNSPYTRVCQCRKPAVGMLELASQEHGLDLHYSYVVGDRCIDMELANGVKAKGILVLTGDGVEEVHLCLSRGVKIEAIVSDLYEAVQWILQDFSNREAILQEELPGKPRELVY